jgi:dTDP-4-amino-4,6-dideoxygalactose transaminase
MVAAPHWPVCNPRANYLAYKNEIDIALSRVLESGRYILASEVAAFEMEFASYIGVKYGVGVGSGTDALHVALRACGIKQGDEVITVSLTAPGTITAIELCQGHPALVDIDSVTYTLNVDRLKMAINERTRAIIPVHLYGHPARIEEIVEIAKRYGLRVIEDCAQSPGAVYNGRKTGAWGDIAAFSFYPTKNLGGVGDGGMVLTNDSELSEKVRLLREYGWRERYISETKGVATRLDELQAAVLRVKLRHLDEGNRRRREIAHEYAKKLKRTSLVLPQEGTSSTHVFNEYVVRSNARDPLRRALEGRGIQTIVHYPVPIHKQPAYASSVSCPFSMANTENVANQVFSLPIYPELAAIDVSNIAEAIGDVALLG